MSQPLVDYAVYFEDGSSRMVSIEKPPGCFRDSQYAAGVAAAVGQRLTGQKPIRVTRPTMTAKNDEAGTPVINEGPVLWGG